MFKESDTSFIRWVTETSLLPSRERDRILLILTLSYIELLANCLLKENGIGGSSNLKGKVDKLLHHNLIDTELHQLIQSFREIRNRAAHEPFFRLKQSDVANFPSYWSKPEYFEHACKGLCGSLWNRHAALFDRVFGTLPGA